MAYPGTCRAADFHGIVAGVLGLLPLCQDGFQLLINTLDFPRTLDLSVGRVELQRDKFEEWRDIWMDEELGPDMKFEVFAKGNVSTARRILRQLALIAQALFDCHAWEDKYGIKPSHRPDREIKDLAKFKLKEGENLTNETQGLFVERCKTNLAIMSRCKFMLKSKGTLWHALTDLLRIYIEDLATFGPKFELEKMVRNEFESLRLMKVDALRRRILAAEYEEDHSQSDEELTTRYHHLNLAAKFALVNKFERKNTADKFSMRDFRIEPTYTISSSTSTMALLFDYPNPKEHRVVLIEWMEDSVRDVSKETTLKTLILATPKPPQLLLPLCYGMVEDRERRRFGLVLAPPAHIRANLPPMLPPGAISEKRMPTSLIELLERKDQTREKILDLGIRFQLAKKIVDAVAMMHCVGWVHKNIRSNSILFFPAANMPLRGPPGPASGFPQPLGYDDPMFVGLGAPNVDEIVAEEDFYDDDREVSVDSRNGTQRLMRITKRPHEAMDMDYYQHPEKRWNPSLRYSRAHDIYSLGCVLLEIGLWRPLHEMIEVEDEDYDRVKKGFQSLTMKLDGMAGSIYGNVVRKCLAIRPVERNEAEARELSIFCAEIGASLDKCWA